MDEATALEGNGRKYRSKKQRPCDLCRTRKIHCKLQADGARCELCQRLERQCTFVLGPLRRKYRARGGNEDASVAVMPQQRRTSHDQSEGMDLGMPPINGHETSRLGDLDMGMGDNDLWSLPTDMRQSFGIQNMSSIMDYYGLGSNGDGGGLPMISSAPEEASNGFNSMLNTHRESLDHIPGFLQDGLSPSRLNAARPASRSTAPTSTTSGSPSEVNSHSNQLEIQQGNHRNAARRRPSAASPVGGYEGSQSSTWPAEFSLEARKGYSNHLIGLSCESDPFLLRHYKYNAYDNYQMFRLDFRRITNDAETTANAETAGYESQPPTKSAPLQFMMSDEAIWQEDLKASERYLSGDGTEASDRALLSKIVSRELGRNLVKL